MNVSYLNYWGKSKHGGHLLAYHSLDVAAVARTYLSEHFRLLASLCHLLKAEPKNVLDMVSFIASFHDVGKFGNFFQQSEPALYLKLTKNHTTEDTSVDGHVLPGWRIWSELKELQIFRNEIGLDHFFDAWCFASLAHHGRPPREEYLRISPHFPENVRNDLIIFFQDISALFIKGKVPNLGSKIKADYNHASWIVTGIIIIADWIGSNDKWFPYLIEPLCEDPFECLKQYWNENACPNAMKALRKSGLSELRPSNKSGMAAFFPKIVLPTGLQNLSENIEIGKGQNLFIIEDATGTGKTEAAVVLAHRLMKAEKGEGIYFALPTMATSNRMYERIRAVYRKLYKDENPSIVLAHSAGESAIALERYYSSEESEIDDSLNDCNEWLKDNRKKALLAHVGVGTIDQALMGVLRVKHQSLRLLGLSRKILIVDEVHACEPYVLGVLGELLTYHALQGGSAILLSATIPTVLRQKLVNSFAKGINKPSDVISEGSFPLVTHFSQKVKDIPVTLPNSEELEKRPSYRPVTVRPLFDVKDVLQVIKSSLSEGKCICWVRNTVFDALEAYDLCKEFKPELFHARFALGDRLRIGYGIEESFGIKGSPKTRAGRFIIATQVIEQSLDVDFDVMITDLAPMDSVIQRSGRLHRHRIRDERILYVLMPNPKEPVKANWYSSMFPRVFKYVYRHHGQLWLTARWLVDKKKFRMPCNARQMIEYVYSGNETFPEILIKAENDSLSDDITEAQFGRMNALVFDEGYSPEGWKTWLDDDSAPTRLGAPTSTIVLCKWDAEGKLSPLLDIENMRWDASSLTIRKALIFDEFSGDKEKISLVKKNRLHRVFIIMEPDKGAWFGKAVNQNKETVKVMYNHNTGFKVL